MTESRARYRHQGDAVEDVDRKIAGSDAGGCRCRYSAGRCGASASVDFAERAGRHGERRLYPRLEIEWKFDPYASENEIQAIDEDKDGQFLSEEEIRLLVRDMMPEFQKSGFLTWLNTGDEDPRPPKVLAFEARIDNPATFTPPEWDRGAGDGDRLLENKSQTMSLPPKGEQERNLASTMRFELPQPVKSFSITTYELDAHEMRVEVDKDLLPAGCMLDNSPPLLISAC